MTQLPAPDHVLLLVHDLDSAAATLTAAGFSVQTRADREVKGGSTYRFVTFDDGSYVLLTAFTPEGAAAHRLASVIRDGEGWADYSFCVASVDRAAQAATAAGMTMGPVHAVTNQVASGAEWGLRLLVAGRGANGDDALPFLVEDTVNRHVRIPAPVPHANGATGIAGITVAAADPAATLARLAVLLGQSAAPGATAADLGGVRVTAVPTVAGAPGTAGQGGLVAVTFRSAAARPSARLHGGMFHFTAEG